MNVTPAMWHSAPHPHILLSSEQVLIPQFSFSQHEILSEIFSAAGRKKFTGEIWGRTHTRTRTLAGMGCGGVATVQLFHFVPFILMIFYVMSCHTHILSVFMAVRCSNAWKHINERLGRYKIIFPQPFVWVAFFSFVVVDSSSKLLNRVHPWIHTNMKIV